MPRSKESVCSLLCLLAVLAFAVPVAAQPPINAGVDIFSTTTGAANPTFVDFSTNPIPAGFFCPGSAPFAGAIGLQGVPLATIPAGIAGSSDVVVQRSAGNFVGGVATMNVIVRALRMTSVGNVVIVCGDGTTTTWRVDVCLCGNQNTTTIQAKVDQTCGCGHFNGTLSVRVCLRFTEVNTGQVRGPIQQLINLNINNMPWCPNPGRSETTIPTSFRVDTNCDGQPDLVVPPTSNFHPGWDCATQAAGDCWTQYAHLTECHSSFGTAPHDHCVNPVCGQRTAAPSGN